jgi:hypothetical protein
MKNYKYFIIGLLITLLSCGKEENKEPSAGLILSEGYIKFSELEWEIKADENIADSRNFCLTNKNNIEIDKSGNLVITMKKIGETWFGGEITSDSTLGYGDYIFYIESKIDNLDANANFSITALNVKSGNYQGLTQMGMAFSLYGDKSLSSNLNYFKYSTENKAAESIIPDNQFKLSGNYSVHKLRILPNEIGFYSYDGDKADEAKLINKYEVRKDNPTNEFKDISFSQTSDSIKIVISLCLPEANKPDKNQEFKVIIKKFEFIPFKAII